VVVAYFESIILTLTGEAEENCGLPGNQVDIRIGYKWGALPHLQSIREQ